jgi:diguanylate cyclase (GGDEF)-like protein
VRDNASDLGWTVVARQPVAVAYAAARHGAWLALALGLAAAALAAIAGAWLADELTRPLRRMARDAEALGTAELPQALPQRGGSLEVEQLSGALGAMTARLLQANAELERRVQARTAELERANTELARLAQHDPLTGLLNRRGLDERLAALAAGARRRQAPLSLLVLDVDHFKHVNDRHGHDVGDQVLRAIAQVLRQRLREVDIVARFGGEEFVVVLADTPAAGAGEVAAALVAAVRQAAMPVVGTVTISCGAAELRTGHETTDAALRRADEALYQAKQSGRNRHCLAPPPVTEVAALQPA